MNSTDRPFTAPTRDAADLMVASALGSPELFSRLYLTMRPPAPKQMRIVIGFSVSVHGGLSHFDSSACFMSEKQRCSSLEARFVVAPGL